MITQPLMFACVLSSGSTWSEPPILPALGDTWPTGGQASAYAVFTDTTGAVLATITGTVAADAVLFQGIPHTQVDAIPAGANCEVFVTDSDGNPYKIRYGRVIRREVTFPNAFSATAALSALAFSDTFQRSALGNYWTPVAGTTQIFDNTSTGIVTPDTTGIGAFAITGTPSGLSWLQYATTAIDKICLAFTAVVPASPSSYAGVERTLELAGAPMESLGAIDANNGTNGWLELFMLMNPPAAEIEANTLDFNLSVDANSIIGNSIIYNQAAGITPGSLVKSAGAAANWTETIASAANKYAVAGFATNEAILAMTNTGSTGAVRDIVNATTAGNAGALAIGDAPGIASMAITAQTGGGTPPFAGIGVSIDPSPPLAYGVSAANNLFGAALSAMRYFTPLNTDNVSANVNMLNNGSGTTIIVLCSDVTMTSWLGVEFDEPANTIEFVVGTSPTTYTPQGTPMSNAVSNNDNYTITYNNNTNTIAVYKNSSLTPLGTWVDTGGIVPHGPGFRYVGFVFNNPADSDGLQVSGWAAQDQV